MRLSATCATLLGGSVQAPPFDASSLVDAAEALPEVAGSVCRQATDSYISAMRLQVGFLQIIVVE